MFNGKLESFTRFVLITHLQPGEREIEMNLPCRVICYSRLHKGDNRLLVVPLSVMTDTPVIIHFRRRLGSDRKNQRKFRDLFATDKTIE